MGKPSLRFSGLRISNSSFPTSWRVTVVAMQKGHVCNAAELFISSIFQIVDKSPAAWISTFTLSTPKIALSTGSPSLLRLITAACSPGTMLCKSSVDSPPHTYPMGITESLLCALMRLLRASHSGMIPAETKFFPLPTWLPSMVSLIGSTTSFRFSPISPRVIAS